MKSLLAIIFIIITGIGYVGFLGYKFLDPSEKIELVKQGMKENKDIYCPSKYKLVNVNNGLMSQDILSTVEYEKVEIDSVNIKKNRLFTKEEKSYSISDCFVKE